jgi:DNA-binding CsgD family transcriptional regulator
MAIDYDITKDYLYQQGQQETKRQIIESMLKRETINPVEIAEIAKVSVEYVQQIAEELKK